ncbi:MAG: hypothetical protein ACAI35_23655 [Candidatus Methylacidiphilales bacterium]|nr:hypothetical protein [Candidatus Methylacidiphilales bacterium]
MSDTCSSSSCSAAKSTEKSTTTTSSPTGIQNGKGDAPRNISENFRSNYEGISWSGPRKREEGGKFKKVYR